MKPTSPRLLHCLQGRVCPVIAIAGQTASGPPVLMNRPFPGAGSNAIGTFGHWLIADVGRIWPQSTEVV